MKKRVLRSYFPMDSIIKFSILSIFLLFLSSCSARNNVQISSNISEKSNLRNLKLSYGAYNFKFNNSMIKGRLHLNYIDENNYWEFGTMGEDSINTVKFNGLFYKFIDGRWSQFSNYSSFSTPKYIYSLFPDKAIKKETVNRFYPNPVIAMIDPHAKGSVVINHNETFDNFKIEGNKLNVNLILLRMLPALPKRFITFAKIRGLNNKEINIFYRRIKNYHPLIRTNNDTFELEISGYISKTLLDIALSYGDIAVYPLYTSKFKNSKTVDIDGLDKFHFGKDRIILNNNFVLSKNCFKVYNIKNDSIHYYGLFIDNDIVAISKKQGLAIEFKEYVNSIFNVLDKMLDNEMLKSAAEIIEYSNAYDRR